MVVFDFLTNNIDRNMKNFVVKGQRVIAIDNEASFSIKYFYHPLLYFGESLLSSPLPEELRNKISQFDKLPEKKKVLANSLENLLVKEEVNSFFNRLEHLTEYAKRGYFQTKEEYRRFDK